MWFYIKLAWRNIFRNKRRTIIASIAIGIGLAALIFTEALLVGMRDNMFRSATSSFLGEAQIHDVKFRETQESDHTVNNLESVVRDLKEEELIDEFTQRTISFSMITSPSDVSSVLLVGIVPETERKLSKVDDTIRDGHYFKGNNERDIVIGSKLAEILEVELGDRIVLTVAQAKSGDLSQEMFRISGIYHFDIKEMDTGMAFIRINKAQEMLGIGKGIHEIAVKFKNFEYALQDNLPFWKKYATNGNEAISWTAILPQLKAVFDAMGISRAVMIIILMIVVIFGIINTLFMSLYERIFEFGVLRAVGTRPWGVFKLMIFEAGALGIVSIFIGTLLGAVVNGIFTKVGIDYKGIEFAGSIIHEMIYPVNEPYQYIIYPIGVIIFTFLVGIYPAVVAAKMSVSDALRKSL